MLQIYIHGEKESGFLDLAPDTVLEIESLQEAFDEEIALGEFSLPIDVDWTDKNRRLLQFAERVENFKRTENFFICTVYHNGFPELIRAKLTILGKKGNFNYRKGKFSASVSGSKGLFGSAIKNKKLTDLALGGIIEWTGTDSRGFAYSHATGGRPQYPYISFAPVAIEKFFDEGRKDFNGEFLAKDTVNTVVIGTGGWVFGRPNPANDTLAVLSGAEGYGDYRTVPFFKSQYVLKECFSAAGFAVSGDFLADPAFANLVVFNNYGLEVMTAAEVDTNKKINPINHVPDILISDWLKSMFSLTSMFPVFTDNNKVQLVYHKTTVVVSSINDITSEVEGDFESEYLDGTATENGYKIAFTWDANDELYSERVKDLTDKTMIGTVAVISDLLSFSIGRPLTTDDIVFVQSENLYYQVADGTSTPVKYDAYSENLAEYKKGDGEKTIDISMSTLCSYVELDEVAALYKRKNYLGCRQKGSYINKAGALVKNPFGNRVFYTTPPGAGIPVSFNHNRDANNVLICPYSLAIAVSDGLSAFHVPWLNIVENAELVKVQARHSLKLLQQLRNSNRFQIAGTVFFLKKIERSLPPAGTLKLELVAL